jgi:hypothetical protein
VKKVLFGSMAFCLIGFGVFYFLVERESEGCYVRHMQEAIELNTERAPLYSGLSQGESESLSRYLIWFERAGVYLAKFTEWKARTWKRGGMDLFCQELVEMTEVPKYNPQISQIPDAFLPLHSAFLKTITDTFKNYLYQDDLKNLVAEADSFLGHDAFRNPHYYCLTRHFIESIARAAYLVPARQEQARSLGLPDPYPILKDYMQQHLVGFPIMFALDQKALSLQAKGIPIYCQDIPPIPIRVQLVL